MTGTPPAKNRITKELDRTLGFWSVFSVAIGAMMGSGIFVLPGLASAIAGPWMALSYLVAGLLVLPAVMSKAELATAMPVAGGAFVYMDRSMGPWMGTIAGLGTWFSLSAKTAFALVGLGGYLVIFSDVDALPFTLSILAGLSVLNIVGAGKASRLQIFVVGLCLAALSWYVFEGAQHIDTSRFEWQMSRDGAGVLAGAGFVFVSYAGVTKVCSIAEEVKDPGRNLPLGMISAQLSVMVIYVLVGFVITGNVPIEMIAEDLTPIATVAGAFGGEGARDAMAAIAVIGLVSMCNAGLLCTSRIPFAMARSKLLPDFMSRLSQRHGTPAIAIVITGALIALLITQLPVTKLAKLASGFKIFIFCIVNLAVIVLRESNARWYKPVFTTPFYPWTQLVGIIGGMALLYYLGDMALYAVLGTSAVGTVWYFAYARKRVERRSAFALLWGEAHTLDATERAEAAALSQHMPPRVIVPVFGDEPAPERLVRLAAAFVEEDGQLEVTRLEEVPDQVSLTAFLEPDDEVEKLAQDTMQVGADVHIPVTFHDIVTHNSMKALLSHAERTHSEWIVMEWPRGGSFRYMVRNPLAWWLDHPPCDLAIFLDRMGPPDGDTGDDFQRILVLAEPGPYDSLVCHVADRLASRQKAATITLFDTCAPTQSASLLRAYHEQLGQQIRSEWRSLVIPSEDTPATIAEISKDYDLLVLGSPPERSLRTLFFGSQEHKIGEQATCSVLKVKAPRHRVHHRFGFADEATEELLAIEPYLRDAAIRPGIQTTSKSELFRTISESLAQGQDVEAETILDALLQRERKQNTALHEGVALTAPLIPGLNHTLLGVFTLNSPIDYRSAGRPMVDTVIVVLAPPQQRQTQLWLLERMSRMVLRGELLSRLRMARTGEAVRNAIRETEKDMGHR